MLFCREIISDGSSRQMERKDFDAVVVGAGPNGLAAAILLQQYGCTVLLVEGKDEIGGGMRTAQLTLPGFSHDICSAIHPLAVASPFLKTLPLHTYGLRYIYPTFAAAHPFEDGAVAVLKRSVYDMAQSLGAMDGPAYLRLIEATVRCWPDLVKDVLGPIRKPHNLGRLVRFGVKGLRPAMTMAATFSSKEAKGLWAGMAAHGIQPLSNMATSAFGMVLLATAHSGGWPIPAGGSASIANAMAAYFIALGGKIETGTYVKSLSQLPSCHALLFDVTPRQLLEIAGHRFSSLYRWQLQKYQYGMGSFKIDWALDAPVPFIARECSSAGTVHLGNTLEEIAFSERQVWKGKLSERPFVLLAQQSFFDASRAPEGKHTAWAYCHVPGGSKEDMTDVIERQVERFAPGFRERILARHTFNAADLEEYNPNYVGGDINGGVLNLRQLFTRPALRLSPYRTSEKGIYVCSSSTPPGGGVHGMCGYYAARRALRDVFNHEVPPL